MNSRTQVEIFGEKIHLLSSENDDYIKDLAKYVDEKMTEVFKQKRLRDTRPFVDCMLLGVNIADDLFKRINELEKTKTQASSQPKTEFKAPDKHTVGIEKQAFLEKQISNLKIQLKTEKELTAKLKKENEKLKLDIKNKTTESEALKKEFDEYLENFGQAK